MITKRAPHKTAGATRKLVPAAAVSGAFPVIDMAASVADITAHKRAEVALRESEERFRMAALAVNNLIWTNNAQGMMEGEQPGWAKFTGQTPKEYRGYGWAKAVHPDDAQPTIKAWNAAVAKKRLFKFEHRVRRHDGIWRFCSVRAVPVIGEDGEIREWVGVHNDITERKKTEATLRRAEVLAASNQKLEKEIVRRVAGEKSLKQSEENLTQLLNHARQQQEELRFLARRVLSAQEEERKRVSRELHDVIAQTLTGINVQLAALKKAAGLDVGDLGQNIARTQMLVEKSVDIVHQFARELRPAMLDDLGLVPALRSFLDVFTKRTGVRTKLTAFTGVEQLDFAHRTVLYRVAQEALTNVARHAHARRVNVTLEKLSNGISLKIADDGKAFRVAETMRGKRLGLLGMRERLEMIGGTFAIESTPGRGTTVVAQILSRNGGGLKKTRTQKTLKKL